MTDPMTTPKAESEADLIARLNKAEADERCNDTMCYEAADVIAALLARAEAAEAANAILQDGIKQAAAMVTTAQASIGAAWCDIKDAPYDIEVTVKVGGMTFGAILRVSASVDDDGNDCDQWQATVEGEHPPCWSGGACWASNEDETMSLQPEAFRLTPPPDAAAALQRAKDEAWNAAVEAMRKGLMIENGSPGDHTIRAPRKEG